MFPHVSNIKWAPSHASKHRPCCQPFPRESLLSDSHSLAKSSNLCLWTPITRLIVKGDISDNTGHYIINYIYIHIMWYPYILYSSFTLSFWCKQSLQLSVCELKFIVAVCVCVCLPSVHAHEHLFARARYKLNDALTLFIKGRGMDGTLGFSCWALFFQLLLSKLSKWQHAIWATRLEGEVSFIDAIYGNIWWGLFRLNNWTTYVFPNFP